MSDSTTNRYKPIPLNGTEVEVKDGHLRCLTCGWISNDSMGGRLGIESHIRLRHMFLKAP